MVENQAIARVLRLGQKRNVRVVRYAMKGTVEEVRKLVCP
jgi:SNF2 family DNA or RNA helicase